MAQSLNDASIVNREQQGPQEEVAVRADDIRIEIIGVTSPEFSGLLSRQGPLYRQWLEFWNSLSPAERDPTTHPVWIVAWLNAFASEQVGYYLVFLHDSSELVGAALFHEERRWTPLGRATEFVCPENAHSFGESMAIAEGYHAVFFDKLFAARTPSGKRPSRVIFGRVDESNLLLSDPGVHRFVVERDPRSMLDASGGLTGVAENLGKNFRGNLRKARNKLKKRAGVQFEVHVTPDDCESAYTRFVAVEGSGWKSRHASAIENHSDRLEFYRQILNGFTESQQAIVTLLRIDDTDAAGQLCIQFGETLCIFKIGYREDFAKYAPGNMLLEYLLENVCVQRGIRQVNLVTSQHWHRNWRPRCQSTFWVEVYPQGVRGWLNRMRFVSPRRIAKAILQRTGYWQRPQFYSSGKE